MILDAQQDEINWTAMGLIVMNTILSLAIVFLEWMQVTWSRMSPAGPHRSQFDILVGGTRVSSYSFVRPSDR